MVLGTGTTIVMIAKTNEAEVHAAAKKGGTIGAEMGATVGTSGSASAIAGVTAVSLVAGAIAGTSATGTWVGAAIGAASGAAAAVGVAASSVGARGLVTSGQKLGSVGWLALGASENPAGAADAGATFDCWRPVLRAGPHEAAASPHGDGGRWRLLKDVVDDPRVTRASVVGVAELPMLAAPMTAIQRLPVLLLENAWSDRFVVSYVLMKSGMLAAHATEVRGIDF